MCCGYCGIDKETLICITLNICQETELVAKKTLQLFSIDMYGWLRLFNELEESLLKI